MTVALSGPGACTACGACLPTCPTRALLPAAGGPVVQIWITDPAGNTVELQQDRG